MPGVQSVPLWLSLINCKNEAEGRLKFKVRPLGILMCTAGRNSTTGKYNNCWRNAVWSVRSEQPKLKIQGMNMLQTAISHLPSEFVVTRHFESDDLCEATARDIAAGKLVGWFQGRMEWGPRALGNRSILCDPRRPEMKYVLNRKIKRRETFRPFAPAILREHVRDWFEQDQDVPFMTHAFQVQADKRRLVPAITHVDGSGRLQTVHPDSNPLFWRLISVFYRLTAVPILLNTSFNENEPIVCRPEQALDCFVRTQLDVLIMGSYRLERRGLPSANPELQPGSVWRNRRGPERIWFD